MKARVIRSLVTCLAVSSLAACNSNPFRSAPVLAFPEEGETPPLMESDKTTSRDVTPITGNAFPISDEYSPMVVDEQTVVFVSDFNDNLDVFQFDYNHCYTRSLVVF